MQYNQKHTILITKHYWRKHETIDIPAKNISTFKGRLKFKLIKPDKTCKNKQPTNQQPFKPTTKTLSSLHTNQSKLLHQ